jgi:hypothetical protein
LVSRPSSCRSARIAFRPGGGGPRDRYDLGRPVRARCQFRDPRHLPRPALVARPGHLGDDVRRLGRVPAHRHVRRIRAGRRHRGDHVPRQLPPSVLRALLPAASGAGQTAQGLQRVRSLRRGLRPHDQQGPPLRDLGADPVDPARPARLLDTRSACRRAVGRVRPRRPGGAGVHPHRPLRRADHGRLPRHPRPHNRSAGHQRCRSRVRRSGLRGTRWSPATRCAASGASTRRARWRSRSRVGRTGRDWSA